MSEPKRYTLRMPDISYGMREGLYGEYVRYEDYARLKAEVAKWKRCESVACDKMLELCGEIKVLKAEVERLQSIHSIDSIGIEQLKEEVERLKAENEAVKLGNKEWRQTAIERGQMNAEDAGAIGLLKAEIERLKEDKQQLEARLDFLENPRS